MKHLSTFLKAFVGLCFCMLLYENSYATHAMGAEITYVCLGPNQYQVQLTFFRDCDGITPASSFTVNYSSAVCGVNSSISVSQVGNPIDVTPLCPGQTNNSSCSGGGGIGVQQWTYRGTLNLPPGCGNDWRLSWSNCCRNNAITTLSSPGNQSMYIEAALDNTLATCNNSPVFNNIPTPAVCAGQTVNYNHGVTDPDGDSLVFSLVSCFEGSGNPVNYGSGYSATTPLTTSSGISVNSQTGAITFTPSIVQRGVICVRVDEYRNGVKIGEVVRDMQFIVLNCSNTPPSASGVNGTTNYTYDICVGATDCFDILGSDPNSNVINMSWNGGISGGTFGISANGSNNPTGTFCWTPTVADVGSHFFTVTVSDEDCPIEGSNTYTYTVNVYNSPATLSAGLDQSFCLGNGPATLSASATGASSFSWSPTTTLSNPSSLNPNADPSTTTSYTITAQYPDGCILTDEVTVTVNPNPTVTVSPPVSFACAGASSIQLTANASGASSYLWSPNAGSSTATTVTVSPSSSDEYWVQVTSANGCTARDTASINVASPVTTVCNIVYASPTGNGAGTQADPASLVDALNQAACNNTVIKLATGTYTLNSPITNVTSNLTIEGGFDPTQNWRKTSSLGATTILRSASNVENAAGTNPRLVAFYINGQSNFRFQDVTIEVADAPSNSAGTRGISTYAVHLSNCSNYDFVRCQLVAGIAGAGDSGTNGVDGANGSSGNNGTNGANDTQDGEGFGGAGGSGGGAGAGGLGVGGSLAGCCFTGDNGNNGGSSSNSRAGGGGGGGGSGGQENRNGGAGGLGGGVSGIFPQNAGGGTGGTQTGCNSGVSCGSVESGNGGTIGADGFAGIDGIEGSAGFLSGGFWSPGGQGGNGTNGTGGAGGRGGGGGAGEGGGGCIDGGGSGGGGGGGGGQGGTAGTGGWGGGSAFAAYLFNNGSGARFDDCSLVASGAGAGGAGGAGGTGGDGGAGGSGSTYTGGEVGCGGDGGPGGLGGDGGDGGDGDPGVNIPLLQDGGTSAALADIAFNLFAQPIINVENIACTNTDIDYLASVSFPWDLGAGANPQSTSGFSVTTQYSNIGRKTVVYGSNTYTGFTNIVLDASVDPIISTSAPLINGQYVICAGTAVNFAALNGGTNYVYQWNMDGGAVPNVFDGTTFETINNIQFNTPGTYDITLRYQTDCCGFSERDTVTLIVEPQPVAATTGSASFCSGAGGVTLAASGGANYLWTPSTGLSATDQPSITANPSATTTYNVTVSSPLGTCSDNTSVTVTVNNLDLSSSSTNASCGANGSATVTPSLGSGNYAYEWATSPVQTTQTASSIATGTYQVVVTDNTTGCQDSTGVLVGTDPNTLTAFISTINEVNCNGGTDGDATVSISGGTGPFAYSWSGGGGNNPTTAPLAAGTYDVTVVDLSTFCTSVISASIPEPGPLRIDSLNSLSSSSCVNGTPDGEAAVNASGGAGPYTYTWPSLGQAGPVATGLTTGSYTVIVEDQRGCQDSLTIIVDCLLPIEFISFYATAVDEHIELDWETSLSIENLGFDIERSIDGLNFDQIGWVEAIENQANYQYDDYQVVPGQRYYYRLKQIDVDGEYAYTEIRQAMIADESLIRVVKVYPNPAKEEVFVELYVPESTSADFVIFNSVGQQVRSQKFQLDKGDHTLSISIQELSEGMYFGKMMVEGVDAANVKFLKMN